METAKWTTEIDLITERFVTAFGHLSHAETNWKKSPDQWSIAQNIDHLIKVNESYFPLIEEIRLGTYRPPFLARVDFVANWMGKMILQGVQPDRRKRIKTFGVWQPSSSQVNYDVIQKFKEHQQKLKEYITSSSDLLDAGLKIHSPASRLVVYRLETAFDIIVAHEKRHLEQAKEVLANVVG